MIIDIEGIPGSGKTYWVEKNQLRYPNIHTFYEHTTKIHTAARNDAGCVLTKIL